MIDIGTFFALICHFCISQKIARVALYFYKERKQNAHAPAAYHQAWKELPYEISEKQAAALHLFALGFHYTFSDRDFFYALLQKLHGAGGGHLFLAGVRI